jgi:hypothetical protein
MFQSIKLKNNKFMIAHSKYRFREDWLLQVDKLKVTTAIDFIKFLDDNYKSVELQREYYICPERRMFEEPAGLKVVFKDKNDATNYCKVLNGEF